MRVGELIQKLKQFDPEMTVITWDPYNDEYTKDVYACDVSNIHDNCIMISNENWDNFSDD